MTPHEAATAIWLFGSLAFAFLIVCGLTWVLEKGLNALFERMDWERE
jgi:flagellar biogenesis protein FliO